MDYFEADVDSSTCLHAMSQGTKVKHFGISNVIYHQLSHQAISYTLNRENVNVMLEFQTTKRQMLIDQYLDNVSFT